MISVARPVNGGGETTAGSLKCVGFGEGRA